MWYQIRLYGKSAASHQEPVIVYRWTSENTEDAIKNGQSRDTDNEDK